MFLDDPAASEPGDAHPLRLGGGLPDGIRLGRASSAHDLSAALGACWIDAGVSSASARPNGLWDSTSVHAPDCHLSFRFSNFGTADHGDLTILLRGPHSVDFRNRLAR